MRRRPLLLLASLAVAALVLLGATVGQPNTPPTIVVTYSGPNPVEGNTTGGAIISYTVTAEDQETGTPSVLCTGPASGSVFPLGVDSVSCTASDGELTATDGFSVVVEDTTDPVFGAPSSTDAVDLTPPLGTEPVAYAITATDVVDASVGVACQPVSGSAFIVGTTSVSCTATDDSGNDATTSFNVTVEPPPNTAPSLVLPGPVTAEATSSSGALVTYSVSATDAEDDPDPIPVCAPPSGGGFLLGTTPVSCTVTDSGGLQATGSFSVVVQDTTSPVVTVPGSMTAQPTGPGGAAVTFSAGATDAVSGSVAAACTPSSGSLFPIGTTLVTCTATDGAGNQGSNSFSISVQDAQAPVVTVPASKTVEANGPGGSIVNYESPTATDAVDGPIAPPAITCTKASGALYPLGTTVVTCSAKDSGGNTGSGSFTVSVQDTTPPVLTAPANLEIQATAAIAASDTRIQTFLDSATASDLVDGAVEVTDNAPVLLTVGTTTVTFTAGDDAGNKTQKTATVTISDRPATPGSTDTTPPGNVRNVKAVAGNLSVSITWRAPAATDFDHVAISRSPGLNDEPESVVFEGRKKSFTARRLEDGVEYRFVIVAYDKAGNRAPGVAVVVLAQQQNLVEPENGSVITGSRRFAWKPVGNAGYYNIQFWHNGKQLSAWPLKAIFLLRGSWRFEGKLRKLVGGTWHVYVWPGFGKKAEGRYGDLYVDGTFVVRKG